MPAKSARLKDLQRQCKTEGLDANREVLSAESQDDTECDAILVTRSEIGSEEEMKKDAKDALGQALQEEELHVQDMRGELFVGNLRGLSFANFKVDQADLRARVDAQDKKTASLEVKIASLEVKNASLEDRVSSLTISLDAYKLLRNRFISTFKRDKLANATEADRRIIGEGNAWAHGGDAVVDATLYQSQGQDRRRDASTYKRLYGMHPSIVLTISHQPTIDVLNTHAGVVASKHKTGSDEFYKRFAKFVELFEESDYDDGYLEGNLTDVTRAYWSFLSCIKDEVTRVDAVEASD